MQQSAGAGTPASASYGRTRLEGHLRLLAIFWFVVAAFWAIPALFLLSIGGVAAAAIPPDVPPFARAVAPAVMTAIGAFFIVGTVLSILTGWGLVQRRSWARPLALVMGAISLIHPPFGTALGIYTLWVLLPAESEREYRAMAQYAA
jgi:hypothetical protein